MASHETVWAFDLGKASIGEAVRVGHEFKHKASLLVSAECSSFGKIMGLIRLRGSPVWKSSFAACAAGCLGSSQPVVSSPTGFDLRF